MIGRILDLCFPPLCEVCDDLLSKGHTLCSSCTEQLAHIEPPFCQKCGESFDGQITDDFSCPNCTNVRLDFDFARSPLKANGTARQLIHALKYRSRFYLAQNMAPFLAELLEIDPRLHHLPENTFVTPVPLHWWRQQKRYGNQAHELAKAFCSLSGHRLLPTLKRIRPTKTQTRLTRKERLSNLRNVFEIRQQNLPHLKDATILLIDDVLTTGSTTHECARVLKKQGNVRQVIVLTLLRS